MKRRISMLIMIVFAVFVLFGVQGNLVKAASKPSKTKIVSIKSYNSKVYLKWKKTKSTTGYQVYRKVKGGKYKLVKNIKKKSTVKYTDKVATGKKYAYKVRAYKLKGKKKIPGKFSAAKTIIGFKGASYQYSRFVSLAKKTYKACKEDDFIWKIDTADSFYGLSGPGMFHNDMRLDVVIIEDNNVYSNINYMGWYTLYDEFVSSSTSAYDRYSLIKPMKFRYKDIF